MNMDPRVCVLLSTYNGEKYLRPLLDSVLSQRDVDVHVLIRDDKSTDQTPDIISDYLNRYQNVELLQSDRNLGPANSFMELLYSAGKYDYYAFADQDDIWKPEKLTAAISLLSQYDPNEKLLYCSNQMLYTDGEEKGMRYTREPNHSVTQLICGNHIAGCTMVINYALKAFLSDEKNRPSPDVLKIRMHDVWLLLVAEITGRVIYDPESYIYYRIHENNTVGVRKDTVADKISKAVAKIKGVRGKNGRSRIAKELLKIEDEGQDSTVVRDFASYQDNINSRLRLLRNKQIKHDCEENRLVFILKTLMNWH